MNDEVMQSANLSPSSLTLHPSALIPLLHPSPPKLAARLTVLIRRSNRTIDFQFKQNVPISRIVRCKPARESSRIGIIYRKPFAGYQELAAPS